MISTGPLTDPTSSTGYVIWTPPTLGSRRPIVVGQPPYLGWTSDSTWREYGVVSCDLGVFVEETAP
jgi:hypothetical protein